MPAKAFCCKAIVRIVESEGLHLDVCTGGELAVALAAGMPPERIKAHGNNKSTAELARALEAGVGWIVVDSFDEIDRLTALARTRSGPPPRVMLRVTVGVEAHTHEFIATAHEDQKFGFSLASGAAFGAAERMVREGVLDLVGLHSHIGSQIFDTSGFEVSARRVLSLQDAVRSQLGVVLPELDLGGGFGIAYTSQDDPATPGDLAGRLAKIVEQECAARRLPVPHLGVEPGRALVGPAVFTLYEVGTVKDVDGIRTYVSVDGGMSDNIRTALYDATYSACVAGRASAAAPMLARVVQRPFRPRHRRAHQPGARTTSTGMPSLEEYYADKARLFLHATDDSTWVVNADDGPALAMAAKAKGTLKKFSVAGKGRRLVRPGQRAADAGPERAAAAKGVSPAGRS